MRLNAKSETKAVAIKFLNEAKDLGNTYLGNLALDRLHSLELLCIRMHWLNLDAFIVSEKEKILAEWKQEPLNEIFNES